MAEQVRIDITAEDKASKKIDQVADKVEDLEKAKPKVSVDADTSDAKRDIDDLLKKADKLTAAPATLLLKSNAAAISSDVKSLTADLDRLDANDPTVEVKAAQINALSGDLDTIDAKLKEINGTPVDVDTKPTQRGLDDVGKSANSSKSVLANMVGNATQDLGALGGVAGSAGVAIGQMGEYMVDAAADGDKLGAILGNFTKVAGPIAGIALATQVLTRYLGDNKAAAEQSEQSVEDWTAALKAGGSGATTFAADLAKSGKIMLNLGDASDELAVKLRKQGENWTGLAGAWHAVFGGGGGELRDLAPLFDKAGVSAEQFTTSVAKGAAGAKTWAQAVKESNLSGDEQEQMLALLAQEQGNYATAQANVARNARIFGADLTASTKALADQERKLHDSAFASDAYARAQEEAADQSQRVVDILGREADALNDQVDAARSAADSTFAYTDAQDEAAQSSADTAAATAELEKATKKHGAESKEAAEATRDLDDAVRRERDALINAATAAQRLGDDQAAAAGKARTAQQKVDGLNDSLFASASSATPRARDAIADYILTANQVPAEKATDIRAAIAAGDFATARRLLDEASATRTASIRADADTAAADAELDAVAKKQRTALINAKLNPNYGAAVGPITGGPRSVDGGGGGAPVPTPVSQVFTFNLPRGIRPDDAIAAADRYARRNGGAGRARR